MNPLDTIKRSIIMFFLGLPVILISIVFFLGFGLGNAGLLFLSAGQILTVPIVVLLCHAVTTFVPGPGWQNVRDTDIGLLVPSETMDTSKLNVWPSYWMAHFTFFCSYILSNASSVYNLPAVSDDLEYDAKVQARKSRTSVIMIFIVAIFLILTGIRLIYTHSENFVGVLIATLIFGSLGYGWHIASNSLGIRTMDIFGVVQQMIAVRDPSVPMMCGPA